MTNEELLKENARLQAEVERLRKAGDAIVDEGEVMARDVSFVTCIWDNRVADWYAAKEGKPVESSQGDDWKMKGMDF